MDINTTDKVLRLLKGELSASEEARLRERVASEENYAEDVAFSVNLVKATEAYERNKMLNQVKRMDARRTLRIRGVSILLGLGIVMGVLLIVKGNWFVTEDVGGQEQLNLLIKDEVPVAMEKNDSQDYYLSRLNTMFARSYKSLDFAGDGFSAEVDSFFSAYFSYEYRYTPFTSYEYDTRRGLGKLKHEIYFDFLQKNCASRDSVTLQDRILRFNQTLLNRSSPDSSRVIDRTGILYDTSINRNEIAGETVKKAVLKPEGKNTTLSRQVSSSQEPAFKRATSTENKTYGYLYTWASAKAVCPSMMTIEDWDALIEQHGGIHDRMAADDKSTFQGLLDAGYPIVLGGQIRKKDGPISGFKKEGWYWSNTEANLNTAWAYYFYKEFDDYKIVKKKVRKTGYLSCLCPE